MKPILFNTEMVRAIMNGRKTVTRRLIKPQNETFDPFWECYTNDRGKVVLLKSPYMVNDILYVRETYREYNGKYYFKADECPDYDNYFTKKLPCAPKWHPSIHMPKEAARIFLRVTNVRVERLQNISSAGIRDEGIKNIERNEFDVEVSDEVMERFMFEELWDSTIKHDDLDNYGWDANPWVWVIEFERCEKPKEEQT